MAIERARGDSNPRPSGPKPDALSRLRHGPVCCFGQIYKPLPFNINMRFGQASMEVLLITAGVLVGAVAAGYYAISATTSVYHELNSVAGGGANLVGSNQPPVASFTYSVSGLTVNFDASASHDPDGTIVSYAWDFGDGSTGSGKTVSHTYASAGSYTVTLTVKDNNGATSAATNSITISLSADNPPSISSFTASPSSGTTSTTFTLTCSASDDKGLQTIIISEGSTTLKTCPVSGTSASCTYTSTFSTGTHNFTCAATDTKGQSASKSTSITVASAPTNHSPIASFTYSPTSPTTTDTVTFTSTSTDPDGDPLTCSWDFGDGTTATGCTVTHMYSTPGTYAVALTVNDGKGGGDSNVQNLTVHSPSPSDTNPPIVALSGIPSGWQNQDANVYVICNDAESGCDASTYRIYVSASPIVSCPADYAQYTYSSPHLVGSHVWVCGAAKDNAGNVGYSKPYEVLVDNTPPTVSLKPSHGKVSSTSFTVSVSCADSDSGCAKTYMQELPFSKTCPSPGSGYVEANVLNVSMSCFSWWFGSFCIPVKVCAYAVDHAGNTSEVVSGVYTH